MSSLIDTLIRVYQRQYSPDYHKFYWGLMLKTSTLAELRAYGDFLTFRIQKMAEKQDANTRR